MVHEEAICKHRNQIERCFDRLKRFKDLAIRDDRAPSASLDSSTLPLS
jgi:hypothetical protein